MLVRRLEDLLGTDREVRAKTWTSRRLLLRDDGFGYSLHDTVMHAGTETPMWYRHHIEAVYCLEGEGELVDRDAGTSEALRPGTLYVLDRHDRHPVRARTDLRMICVFTPACTGAEVHDASGAYPPAEAPA
jgi:L-ectoine synthase